MTCLLADPLWVDRIHQGTWEHGRPGGNLWRVGYRQAGKTGRRELQDTLARKLLWVVHWTLGRLSRRSEDRWELWEQDCSVGGTLALDQRGGCSLEEDTISDHPLEKLPSQNQPETLAHEYQELGPVQVRSQMARTRSRKGAVAGRHKRSMVGE